MKKCCKNPDNWKNNGTKDKKLTDLGKAVKVESKTYITCIKCEGRMFLLADKTLVDAEK